MRIFFHPNDCGFAKKHFPKQGDRITDECVVTVSAAFNDDERVATQNAMLLGGFKHCTILDEPTAVLLSYINGSTHDEDNDDEDARKISTISNKLESNIYVRNADGKFTLLIPSDLSCTSGTFHYTITDDNVAYFPFYLYSGTEPEGNEDNTDTFTQLAGRMIRSKPEYKKGDKIPINWSIDDNKVITVQIQNDKSIRLSRLLTPEEIAKNLVKDYQVNR